MRPIIAGLLAWIALGGDATAQTNNGDPLKTGRGDIPVPSPVVPPNPPGTNPVIIGNPNESPVPTPLDTPLGDVISTPDVNNPQSNIGRKKPTPDQTQFRVYVGTYTNAKSQSEGIYQFTFDSKQGTLSNQAVAAKLANPSFLALHPSMQFLYAVSEVGKFAGKSAGSVSAYAVDLKSGALTLLDTKSTGGSDPCYVTVDGTGSAVLVANYSGGSVSVFPIERDGKLGNATATIQHQGSGANQTRQSSAHAHSIDLDPTNQVAVVADLGLDKLMIYRFDAKTASLRPHSPPSAAMAPGSGPRHLAFHPDGRHAYVIHELNNTIADLDFDRSRGTFSTLQSISTRPPGAQTTSYTAEVLVHPSGRFVYGSNRGDDTLAIFKVEPASGKLSSVGFQPTGGKNPRNFEIDPTGQFLLCGNQDSNTITLFRIDADTGQLTPSGEPIPCPAPVCIRFAPLTSTP